MAKHSEQNSDSEPEDRAEASSFSLPWSKNGPYGARARARRDPQLDALIEANQLGKRKAIAYRQERPMFALRGAPHNPYSTFVAGIASIVVGVFVCVQTFATPWFAILMFVAFVGAGILIIVMNALRIPAWHRARKVAKQYLQHNEGSEMPPELKVWM